jgi:excisionase family DNA binding protein
MIEFVCSGLRTMSERRGSVDAVAHHLGVAKDTSYRWIETRRLPAHRVGRLWKFKLSGVDAWVERSGANEKHHGMRAPSKGGSN